MQVQVKASSPVRKPKKSYNHPDLNPYQSNCKITHAQCFFDKLSYNLLSRLSLALNESQTTCCGNPGDTHLL